MRHHNPEYNKVLADIYQRALSEFKCAQSWLSIKKPETAAFYLNHLTKCEALVDLLESATVFNIGGGYHQQFCIPLEARLESFKFCKQCMES